MDFEPRPHLNMNAKTLLSTIDLKEDYPQNSLDLVQGTQSDPQKERYSCNPTTEMKGGSQNLAAYNISPLAAGGPRGLTKSKSDGLESVAATATV